MIFRRAWPEDAILLGNLLVGNAPVVRFRSPGAEPQFIEYLTRGLALEVFALAEASRQVADDLPVNSRLAWGINRFIIFDHASFQARNRAFVLCPRRPW